MASTPHPTQYAGTPPTDTVVGPHDSLFMVMSGLGSKPASGQLMRGLTPYLDQLSTAHVVLLTERQRREPWTGSGAIVAYQEVVHWARAEDGGRYRGVAIKGPFIPREDIVKAFERDPLGVVDWVARRAEAAVIASDAPLALVPVEVLKPWGREVWFSGMESRGVSLVGSATGTTELPYALGMFPVPMIGEDETPPILLKILEPHADAGLGDLYLEVHREKWEVYVVLAVDRAAWPDGVGRLRAGLAPQAIARYRSSHGSGWAEALSADLQQAIGGYETVRREIDARCDERLTRDGLSGAEPQSLERYRAMLADLPESLRAREAATLARVDEFLGHVPMPVGQVAVLPPGVLHALRHGVAVVEFQTPTYERLVALSSQKVLTQAHWDTRAALELAAKEPYAPPAPAVLLDQDGRRIERVVDFPRFQVERVVLPPGAVRDDKTPGNGIYHLLFGLTGEATLSTPGGGERPLAPRTALLLGASLGGYSIQAGAEGCSVLLARPLGAGLPATRG